MGVRFFELPWYEQPQEAANVSRNFASGAQYRVWAPAIQAPLPDVDTVPRGVSRDGVSALFARTTSQEIETTAPASEGDFTLIAHFSPSVVDSTSQLVCEVMQRNASPNKHFISIEANGQISAVSTTANNFVSASGPVATANQFYTAVAVFNKGQRSLFVNGVLSASNSTVRNCVSLQEFRIGLYRLIPSAFSPFSGHILLSACFARAFTNQEAVAVSNNPWQLFAPRQIWVPSSSASPGGNEYLITPSGSVSFSGSAQSSRTKIFLPSGSVSLSGTSAFRRERVIPPSGSVSFSGTRNLIRERAILPSGAINFSGSAALTSASSYTLTPGGTVQFSGAAALIKQRTFLPSGVVTFSGNAGIIFIPAGGSTIPTVNRISVGVGRSTGLS